MAVHLIDDELLIPVCGRRRSSSKTDMTSVIYEVDCRSCLRIYEAELKRMEDWPRYQAKRLFREAKQLARIRELNKKKGESRS